VVIEGFGKGKGLRWKVYGRHEVIDKERDRGDISPLF